MTKIRDYPQWICSTCGAKYGTRLSGQGSTWHAGQCDLCGIQASVTEPKDFGHLQEGWRQRVAKSAGEKRE